MWIYDKRSKQMKVIYVCSRFKGDVKKHKKWATKFSNFVAREGNIPITVHLYLDKAMGLNEENGDREKLLEAGRMLVMKCDELWIYKPDGWISHGMAGEIRTANINNIPIKEFMRIPKKRKNVDCD